LLAYFTVDIVNDLLNAPIFTDFSRNVMQSLRRLVISATAMLACCSPWSVQAQQWPAHPITLIVSSGAGAGVDTFGRLLAERLQSRLGQSVIVENRPGASGMIAASMAARATPDGYTLFLMPNTLIIAPYVLAANASTVNVMKELKPVSMPAATMMVMAVNGKFADAKGIKTVQDFINVAKKDPGFAYSGGDNGSPMNVMGEQFRKEAGLDLTNVPYGGVAKMVTALLAGQINMAWMPISGNTQYFRDGSLRVLGTSSPKRSAQMPDVPAMAELGYRDVKATAWYGILAPVGTPDAIVTKLNQAINASLQEPGVRAKLEPLGYEAVGGAPDVLSQQMREDDERYRRLTADLHIRAN
jgi:tripartite-type tricarboxylate transporter receptor subunit TctC